MNVESWTQIIDLIFNKVEKPVIEDLAFLTKMYAENWPQITKPIFNKVENPMVEFFSHTNR